jgi:hypothetical protein
LVKNLRGLPWVFEAKSRTAAGGAYLTPTRSRWKVLEARTKVPVAGNVLRTSITCSRELGLLCELVDVRKCSSLVSARRQPSGAEACVSDKVCVRKRACPDRWDKGPAFIWVIVGAPRVPPETERWLARSAGLRPPGQGVKCFQVRARLQVSVAALHLEHDCAGNADPLDVGIAKSVDCRLAATRTGDRGGPGCATQDASDDFERSLHSCMDLQRRVA